MAIRVPLKYNEQIGLDTPNVPLPRMPNSQAVLQGINLESEANQQLAGTVGKLAGQLGEYAQQKRQEENEVAVASAYNSYLKDIDTVSYSNEEETVKINNQEYKRPKGILNRKLSFAKGSTAELENIYNNRIRGKYVDSIPDPRYKMKLAMLIDKDFYSRTRENAIKNEAREVNAFNISTAKSAIDAKLSTFSDIQTLNTLDDNFRSLDSLVDSYINISGDTDLNNIKNIRQENYFKAISNLIDSSFISDSTGDTAREIINNDAVKNKIDKNKIQDISKYIDNKLKKNSDELNDSLNEKLINNELTIQDVLSANRPKEKGGIGGTRAKTLLRAFEKSQEEQLTNIYNNDNRAEKYINTVRSTLLSNVDNTKFNQIIIDAFSDGDLTIEEGQSLKKMKKLLETQNSLTNPWVNNIPIINNFISSNTADIKKNAAAIQDYLSQVDSGRNPDDVREEVLRNQYNSTYPTAPLGKEDKVIDPNRERQYTTTPLLEKLGKGFGLGVAGVVKGVGGSLEANKKIGIPGFIEIETNDLGKSISAYAEKMEDFYSVPDPDFSYKLSAGFGSMSTFFIPGLGVAKGLQSSLYFSRMAGWLGVGASSVLEATVESGGTYKQAIENGFSDKQATEVATKSFWLNLPLTAITNKFGIFGESGTSFAKLLKSGANEGIQEVTQTVIGNILTNEANLSKRDIEDIATDPRTWAGSLDSLVIGSIVGGGTKLSLDAVSSMEQLGVAKQLKDKLSSERGSIINPFNPQDENKPLDEKQIEGIKSNEISIPGTPLKAGEEIKVGEGITIGEEGGKAEATQIPQAEQAVLGEQNVTENQPGIPSQEQVRQEPIKAEPIQGEGVAQVSPGGILQAQTGKKVSESDVLESVAEISSRSLSPISTRLKIINPKLKYSLRRFESNLGNAINDDLKEAVPFIQDFKALNESDRNIVDLALKNGEFDKVDEVMKKNNRGESFKSIKDLLSITADRAQAVGLEFDIRENYFPRKVINANKLLDYIYGKDTKETSKILRIINEKEKELGGYLTDEQKADIVDRYLRGANVLGQNKPSNLKTRKIEIIDSDLNRFYEDSPDALIDYIESMNQAIAMREFFGKNIENISENVDDNISAYILDLIQKGEIKPSDEKQLKEILQARFNARGPGKFVSLYRDLSYIQTMGSYLSAVTQLTDIGLSAYKNGLFNTATSLIEQNKDLTKETLGISKIAEELQDNSKSSKAVKKVFDFVGLTAIDNIAKNATINASFKKYTNLAKNPTVEFNNQLNTIFGEESGQVIEDLNRGYISDNVKFLLFNDLLDIQPVALSEMPETYLRSGNGRIFYMLKTYTIKQLDIYRNDIALEMKKNPVKAINNLIKVSFSLALLGAGADTIKNFMLNKPFDLSDLVTDNLLKLLGFSKFTIYKARQEGVSKAIAQTILPPGFTIGDDIIKDIGSYFKDPADFDLSKARSINNIPIGGKLYYWWFGKGQDLSEQKMKSRKTLPKRRLPER